MTTKKNYSNIAIYTRCEYCQGQLIAVALTDSGTYLTQCSECGMITTNRNIEIQKKSKSKKVLDKNKRKRAGR